MSKEDAGIHAVSSVNALTQDTDYVVAYMLRTIEEFMVSLDSGEIAQRIRNRLKRMNVYNTIDIKIWRYKSDYGLFSAIARKTAEWSER